MNTQLKALLELQKIDSDLIFLRELREKRPLELEKERGKLVSAQSAVEELQGAMRQLKMECDRGELELKKNQAEIDKLQVALNTARSNQEYQVLRDQIEKIKEKSGAIEEEVLLKMNRMDELDQERQEAVRKTDEVSREFQSKEDELRAFLDELNRKMEGLQGERAEKQNGVQSDALELYEKVLNRYDDSALVTVENTVCQGCHMSVTKQILSQLMVGNELVQCMNCLRILYLPEHV